MEKTILVIIHVTQTEIQRKQTGYLFPKIKFFFIALYQSSFK